MAFRRLVNGLLGLLDILFARFLEPTAFRDFSIDMLALVALGVRLLI